MCSVHKAVLTFTTGCVLMLVGASAHATPVTNFSFESGAFVNQGSGTMVLPVGSTAMTGWTVTADQLAWIGNPNPWQLSAQEGNFFLDLTAYPTGAPFGGVTQTLATSIGQSYLVNYYLGSLTSVWGGPPVSIIATAGGASQTCTVSTTSTVSTWTPCSMSFSALSTSTALNFVGSAGFQYIGLDNVSVAEVDGVITPVTPVPEPTSMVLFGSGLVAISMRRRKAGQRQ